MPEPPCPHCHKELTFIGQLDCSDYYRCDHCYTVWDFMLDDTDCELVNVTEYMQILRRKKVAS